MKKISYVQIRSFLSFLRNNVADDNGGTLPSPVFNSEEEFNDEGKNNLIVSRIQNLVLNLLYDGIFLRP